MKSKWFNLKPKSIEMRKAGHSLPSIHKELGIPKSTLSHWLRDISLTKQQKAKLHKSWQEGLRSARKEAVKWHQNQKAQRMKQAEESALEVLQNIDITNHDIQKLALALLYLGEGTKKNPETGMGSSDPEILQFFIYCLTTLFAVPREEIRCELHLRADQDPVKIISYWSKTLKIAKSKFYKPTFDKRTLGSKTKENYKGVCLVRCGRVEIQRKLVYIARHFCTQVAEKTRD